MCVEGREGGGGGAATPAASCDSSFLSERLEGKKRRGESLDIDTWQCDVRKESVEQKERLTNFPKHTHTQTYTHTCIQADLGVSLLCEASSQRSSVAPLRLKLCLSREWHEKGKGATDRSQTRSSRARVCMHVLLAPFQATPVEVRKQKGEREEEEWGRRANDA